MPENLTFHFEGALADEHRMNFYESARFQYAASRLLVKLSQFRNSGRFNKKISTKSNYDVRLVSQSDGSFNINVEDSGKGKPEDDFMDVSLGDLVAFVSERVIEKIDEESLKEAGLISRRTDADQAQSEVDKIAESVGSGKIRLDEVPIKIRDVVKRRLAEISREERMNENSDSIKKIDFARSQKLIAMSAPLISEMATALRRSADSLEVSSSVSGSSKPVLFLDQDMAADIETSIVDKEVTALLCDVVQFNKDNGWGKVRIEKGTVTVSFSIPYDILPRIKQTLIDTMKKDQVYLQTYFVYQDLHCHIAL